MPTQIRDADHCIVFSFFQGQARSSSKESNETKGRGDEGVCVRGCEVRGDHPDLAADDGEETEGEADDKVLRRESRRELQPTDASKQRDRSRDRQTTSRAATSEKDQGSKDGWGERAGQKCSTAVAGDEHSPEYLDEGDSPVLGGRRRTRTRESGNRSNRDKEKRRRSNSAREAPRLLLLSDFCKDAGGQTGEELSEEQPQREVGGKEKSCVDLQEADSHPLAAFGFARKEPVQADGKRGLDAKLDEEEGPKQDFADRERRPNDQRKSHGGGVKRREDGDGRQDQCEEGMHGEEPPEYVATQMESDIDLEERQEARMDDLSGVSVDKLASSKAHSQPDSGNEENLEEELALSSRKKTEREREAKKFNSNLHNGFEYCIR